MLDTTRVRRVVGPGLCPTVRGTATVCNGSSESSARVFLFLARTFMSLPLLMTSRTKVLWVQKK